MMKLFFASIVFAVFISPARALNKVSEPTVTRTVKISGHVSRIILNGDADVIFIKDNAAGIIIEERAAMGNTVKLKHENGVLTIESREFYRGKKPLILIPAPQLESLEINGDGSVSTAVLLQSKALKVFVNGQSKIKINTTGKVYFDSSPEFYLRYKK